MLSRLHRLRWLAVVLGVVPTALVVLAFVRAAAVGSHSTSSVADDLHELTGPPAWPRNVQGLRARLDALGLSSPAAGTRHYRIRLDLSLNGKPVTVPAGIGIAGRKLLLSPLYTRRANGVVHVESPHGRRLTLGEFFGVWGVPLTTRCIGGECAMAGGRLGVYVDSRRVRADPAGLILEPHQHIVFTLGT